MIPSGLIRTEAAMVVQLGELMMILDLHRQGLSITAIARRTGRDPKTVRKYIERGLEPPAYGPRQVGRPSKLAPYLDYLRERVTAFPDLSAVRLTRELRERGYKGAYTAVKRFVAAIRPESQPKPFEVRFETPAGYQAQVDFARFVTSFTDEPGVVRIVWLFSMVLGHSRHIFARFVMHQDLQTLLRCHMLAFTAIGGVPIEILYDRMKTAVTGEDGDGHIIYNRSLIALGQHYGFSPQEGGGQGGAAASRIQASSRPARPAGRGRHRNRSGHLPWPCMHRAGTLLQSVTVDRSARATRPAGQPRSPAPIRQFSAVAMYRCRRLGVLGLPRRGTLWFGCCAVGGLRGRWCSRRAL
jgi:transposase